MVGQSTRVDLWSVDSSRTYEKVPDIATVKHVHSRPRHTAVGLFQKLKPSAIDCHDGDEENSPAHESSSPAAEPRPVKQCSKCSSSNDLRKPVPDTVECTGPRGEPVGVHVYRYRQRRQTQDNPRVEYSLLNW